MLRRNFGRQNRFAIHSPCLEANGRNEERGKGEGGKEMESLGISRAFKRNSLERSFEKRARIMPFQPRLLFLCTIKNPAEPSIRPSFPSKRRRSQLLFQLGRSSVFHELSYSESVWMSAPRLESIFVRRQASFSFLLVNL